MGSCQAGKDDWLVRAKRKLMLWVWHLLFADDAESDDADGCGPCSNRVLKIDAHLT
jgi:hypothetical protein